MPNRLVNESSPYLLQHANNPVDWFPWGDEALQRARDEDKPIFLSIGYSACHWCHVMEHESFEDSQIAALLNENFINIKVDREERPDLDQIYMNAMMALRGGGGGWPLSVFLTPEQEVFFGGTYWPPRSRVNLPGFDHVLRSVLQAFTSQRDAITAQSKQITSWLNSSGDDDSGSRPNRDLIQRAAETLIRNFDAEQGGFGDAPKFPHPMDLMLLVRLTAADREPGTVDAGEMIGVVDLTLRKMAAGGIFDHLAGGFARYSVDRNWLVPHFEKMLYDNALLADVYLAMSERVREPVFADVARQTLNYLLDYMTDPGGGLFSTEDADSEGVEGKFYVWSKSEIIDRLGPDEGPLFCEFYNVSERGNFEGQNILHVTTSLADFSADRGIAANELAQSLETSRRRLLEAREKRVRPGLDDKVLTSWNGLAISAFAHGYQRLAEPRYLEAAQKAARFLLGELRREDGRLLHTWRQGTAKLDAYLDDYAYLIMGLIDLYHADFDLEWLDQAVQLVDQLVAHFADLNGGGFYFTADDHERLIARTKSFQDSSVPSGNAMAALALLRLGRMLGNQQWNQLAEATISASVPLMQRAPLASGQMLIAVDSLLNPAWELVLVVASESEVQVAAGLLGRHCGTNISGLLIGPGPSNQPSWLETVVAGKTAVGGQMTLYICSGMECQSPIVGLEPIRTALSDLG